MKKVSVIIISSKGSVTLEADALLRGAGCVFVQTRLHPCYRIIEEMGIANESMDDLYESSMDFDALMDSVAKRLYDRADCVYVCFGTCSGLIPQLERNRRRGYDFTILPGVRIGRAAFPREQDAVLCTANSLPRLVDVYQGLLIEEVDNVLLAGELKLRLTEYYPDSHQVEFRFMGNGGEFSSRKVELHAIDRQRHYDSTTVLFVPPVEMLELERFGFLDLYQIMQRLRRRDGCAWDRAQTHASLRESLLEETYEVIDAIENDDSYGLCEELGDLLMLICLNSCIAEEYAEFSMRDVTSEVAQKMIRRHTHVFGKEEKTADTEKVLTSWEKVKMEEKSISDMKKYVGMIPKSFPALLRAAKVQGRVEKVSGTSTDVDAALQKLKDGIECFEKQRNESTAGEALFALVDFARTMHIDAELALQSAVDRFINA